jgi:outer membrane receptor for ferric coprogen and ferric-rhodotorulic acid
LFSTNGRKVLSAVSLGSLLALASLRAQEASPSPAPSGSVLNRVVVTGANIPIDESFIPTTQPSGVVFGLDINVKDVPRNVTIISRAQLDDISIRDV